MIDRLGELDVPTLDHVRAATTSARRRSSSRSRDGIPGAEWVLFEESAHMPYLEEPERYLEVVGGFLERVEAQTNA